MDISRLKKVYCVGIKGSGVFALAQLLKARGVDVSGSDTGEKFFTQDVLKKNNIFFHEKFATENVPQDADLVVYSTAYNENNNVEILEAKKKNIPLLSYPQMLGEFFKERMGIAVCGSHGKTTTTAMLASALKDAGVDPSSVVGGEVQQWKSSVLSGAGDYFVVESDEYQNKLKFYDPWSVILTSVDWDHPDFFPDFESYKKVFKDFVAKIPKTGFLVVWGDSSDTIEVSKEAHCNIVTYGFSDDNEYKIVNYDFKNAVQSFEIIKGEQSIGVFEISLSGKHNVLNSAAVIALCHKMGLNLDKVKESIKFFEGTKRRFEYVGEYNGAVLIDDYAHHPDEIRATLSGARQKFADKNINVVFHPHTFTRTKALLHEFAQSFDDADKAVIIDIYGSAREQQGGVSSEELVNLINKYTHEKAEYIPTINEAIEFFKERIGENDVLISMGAGDVWKVVDRLKDMKHKA